jgi:hypothetical protein
MGQLWELGVFSVDRGNAYRRVAFDRRHGPTPTTPGPGSPDFTVEFYREYLIVGDHPIGVALRKCAVSWRWVGGSVRHR